jgi:hypothetical protein
MKTKLKNINIKRVIAVGSFFILLCFTFISCNNILDKPPLDEVPEDAFFLKASNLKLYMNQFYSPSSQLLNYGGSGGLNYSMLLFQKDLGTDNEISSGVNTRLNGQNIVPTNGGGWDFSWVRKVNYFLEKYHLCKDPFEDYQQYVGEAHFFRAQIYFHLVKRFGAVPWYNKVLNVDSKRLFDKRTPRNIVIDHVIADLDSAATYLTPERNDNGLRLNKWSALALQSRVALYEGTWEKYHANDPFGVKNPDPDKYFKKAIEASSAIMNSGRFAIYSTGHPERDFHDYFNLPDYSSNKEVILWKKFDKSQGIKNYRSIVGQFPSGRGVTKSLADAFLCTDGKPITISPLFKGHDSFSDEMANRDPRYYQTIVTPDTPYAIVGNDTTELFKDGIYDHLFTALEYTTPTGYIERKGYNAHKSTHDKSGNNEPIILFDYDEVLLNFAEAKSELRTITQTDINKSVNLLRHRVGMSPMHYPVQFMDPNWNFPKLSPIINEIRRERRVELSLEGFRLDDIFRWAAADQLIVGKRPKGILFGEKYPNNPYPDDSNGFMDPFQKVLPSGYNFHVDRDYLLPLPKKQLTLNSNLKQNPGWNQ